MTLRARVGRGQPELQTPSVLDANAVGASDPSGRIEERARLHRVIRDLRQSRVGHRDRAGKGPVDQGAERVEHVAKHRASVDRHRQGATYRAIAEDRVRPRGLLRIDEIEREVGVLERGISDDLTQGVTLHLADLLGTQHLEHVGFSRKEAGGGGVEIRGAGEHHAVELRATAIVHRIGDQLDPLARLPCGQSKAPGANAATRDIRCLELRNRGVGEDVLRHDDDLVDEIVELLGRALLEPGDGREGILHRDAVDVPDQRRDGRAERGILVQRDAETHVARAHGTAVVPAGAGIQHERDGERVRRPLPALGKLRLEPLVADRHHLVTDVGEAIVQHVGDLAIGLGGDEPRHQSPHIARNGDHEGASHVARSGRRRIGPLAAHHGRGEQGEER